ncbi:PepSY domain-containing protein [Shewanella aestuarii]|uniref:PepSY domain-containing protein n=1 Tax=Shewanella aestuarii TaxID=1028752 RepID=A0A6G9QMX0_9GAMM|nr:PepSY domain-containing protein [Shewanella aestuarii]QIR15906.1 PepSY domain-containing protein [Shewanella aestuarii]
MHKLARSVHKWLMLFLGVQFVIWSVTGAYMVFFDIDYIHGDTLVNQHQVTINPQNIDFSLAELIKAYPQASQISMGKLMNQDVYRFHIEQGDSTQLVMLSAQTGERLSAINQAAAVTLAQYYYQHSEHQVAEVNYIADNPPFEISPRHLPVWQIHFDHFSLPTLYVSAQSGLLVGKRHVFWRAFDWMFRFHIMDYSSGENIDNKLLFFVALLSTIGVISGLVLTYFRVFKTGRSKRKTRLVRHQGGM